MLLNAFDITALIAKWAIYLSFAAVVGGSFMLTMLRHAREEALALRYYIGGGAVLGILAVGINYSAQIGAFSASGIVGMLDYSIHTFLWPSSVGDSVVWRASGFGLAFIGSIFLISATLALRKLAIVLLTVAAVLIAIGFTVIGHSVELNSFARAMLFLHVLAIACWVGAFYPLWRLCASADLALLQRTMHRFGLWGIGLVSVVVFTGGSLLWQLFDQPSDFVSTDYGIAVVVKLSLVAVIMFFAALHKFILVPNLAGDDAQQAQQRLKRSIALEALVGCFILATTAVLSSVLGPASF